MWRGARRRGAGAGAPENQNPSSLETRERGEGLGLGRGRREKLGGGEGGDLAWVAVSSLFWRREVFGKGGRVQTWARAI